MAVSSGGGSDGRKIDFVSIDAVIEAYKKSVDRTLIRENLRRTPEERLRQLQSLQRFAAELQRAGRDAAPKRR